MDQRPENVDMNNLSEEQAVDIERLKNFKIKSHMLNKPCGCGSGKKFKRCHAPIIRNLKRKINENTSIGN